MVTVERFAVVECSVEFWRDHKRRPGGLSVFAALRNDAAGRAGGRLRGAANSLARGRTRSQAGRGVCVGRGRCFDFGHKRPRRRSCAVAVVRPGFEFGRGASGDELQRRDGDFAGDKRSVVVVVRYGRLRRGAFGRGRGVLDFGGGVGGRGGADALTLFHIGGAFAVFPAGRCCRRRRRMSTARRD